MKKLTIVRYTTTTILALSYLAIYLSKAPTAIGLIGLVAALVTIICLMIEADVEEIKNVPAQLHPDGDRENNIHP